MTIERKRGTVILETPKGKEQLEDLENIRVLKSLIKN